VTVSVQSVPQVQCHSKDRHIAWMTAVHKMAHSRSDQIRSVQYNKYNTVQISTVESHPSHMTHTYTQCDMCPQNVRLQWMLVTPMTRWRVNCACP